MARIIKFRAWDKSHNSMEVCHDLYWFEENYVRESNDAGSMTGDWVIMQYTGLKDRHGVEIYEGDLLAYTDKDGKYSSAYQCKWGERSCGCCATIIGYDTDFEAMSIIGNIYENPDRLNEK